MPLETATLVRDGTVCTEAITKLSTEQLKAFLVIHAGASQPEAVDVLAAVRTELERRAC